MPSISPSPAVTDSDAAYNTSHRAFLQSFLSHSTLTLTTARPILARILSAASSDPNRQTLPYDVTDADLLSYINAVNAAISAYDLEIRSTIPQTGAGAISKERIYAIVNTTSDPATQLATTHTPDEIAFVKRVLDAMFDTYNAASGTAGKEILALTDMQATQLHRVSARDRASNATQRAAVDGEADSDDEEGLGSTQRAAGGAAQSISLTQAGAVLKSLVAEGWLAHPVEPGARSYYVLSPRALLELKNWLLETYNEPAISGEDGEEGEEAVERVKLCRGCNEIVLSGQRCAERTCGVRLHDRCGAAVMRAQRGGQPKCPACAKEWTGRDFVGVRAVKEVREKWLRETNGTGSGANGHAPRDEDQDEDDEEMEDGEEE